MSKRLVCLQIVVLFAGLAAFTLQAQGPRPAEPTKASFNGKAILVEAGERTSLENPEIVNIGGHAFVTGVSVKGAFIPPEDFPGRKILIPLGKVTRIVEFDNVQQLLSWQFPAPVED